MCSCMDVVPEPSPADKLEVRCESCTESLLLMNGESVPAHITTVTVSRQQYNAWKAQRQPVELA
jgi:hypothetical protein